MKHNSTQPSLDFNKINYVHTATQKEEKKYQQRDIDTHKNERAIECEKFKVFFFIFSI